VKNILKENGLEPGPKRGEGTCDEFLKIHAATLWQCDFYSKKVLTIKGFRDLFLLVFLHVESRRVFIAPSTFHPNEEWVKEQAHDTKFTASFDQFLKTAELECRLRLETEPLLRSGHVESSSSIRSKGSDPIKGVRTHYCHINESLDPGFVRGDEVTVRCYLRRTLQVTSTSAAGR
jgi:hypothetical protein